MTLFGETVRNGVFLTDMFLGVFHSMERSLKGKIEVYL